MGGRKKWLLWLVVLPAEAGRADQKHCSEGAGCNKREKTCEKFRQMKMHSEVSVPLPPSSLIVGHVDCVQAEGISGEGDE